MIIEVRLVGRLYLMILNRNDCTLSIYKGSQYDRLISLVRHLMAIGAMFLILMEAIPPRPLLMFSYILSHIFSCRSVFFSNMLVCVSAISSWGCLHYDK